jgi:DNA-binding GntR family transcriptional regulator
MDTFFYILLTEFLLLHIVADLENTTEETKSIYKELQKQCASLQEALKIVEAEKMVGDLCFWLNIILLLLCHSQFHSKCRMP